MSGISKKGLVELVLSGEFIFLLGIIFVMFVPTLIATLSTTPSAAWTALLSGVFVTIMSKLDSIAEFSFGPIRTKMREVVAEAIATIDQLQNLAVTMSSAFLSELIASSFMGGMSIDRRLKIQEELTEQLRSLGVSSDKLQRAMTGWNAGISIIYHRIIADSIVDAINPKNTHEHNDLAKELQGLVDFSNSVHLHQRNTKDSSRIAVFTIQE